MNKQQHQYQKVHLNPALKSNERMMIGILQYQDCLAQRPGIHENELNSDESLIRNENGDIIGIVSPRKLYIRGDLVDLQKETGKAGKTFDKTDVAEHLVDIVFGNDNAKLNLFKSNKDYQFWLDAYYTSDDTQYLLELAKLLNTLSDTTEFEDEELALRFLKTNYADVPYNFYNIKIIPKRCLMSSRITERAMSV